MVLQSTTTALRTITCVSGDDYKYVNINIDILSQVCLKYSSINSCNGTLEIFTHNP